MNEAQRAVDSEQSRKSEGERIARESAPLKQILADNPKIQTFYELDGRYFTANPRQVITDPNQAGDIPRIREISRSDMETRLSHIGTPTLEETTRTLDQAIDALRASEGTDPSKDRHLNLRRFLVDIRLALSGHDAGTKFSAPMARSLTQVLRIANQPVDHWSASDTASFAIEAMNLVRTGAPEAL